MKKSDFEKIGKFASGRRAFLKGFAGSSLSIAAMSAAAGAGSNGEKMSKFLDGVSPDERSIDEIYEAALAEGGQLICYVGGDTPNQFDMFADGFRARFPGIELISYVDYSKFHDVRLDTQFATGRVVPDIVQLQTLHDFTRWARQGQLMAYKPASFDAIHPLFRDAFGFSTAVIVFSFSYMVNQGLSQGIIPSVESLADPQWRGRIASSYPHDDDAVAFLYKLYVEQFGFDWLEAMSKQDIAFNRGSNVAGELANSGQKTIGVGSASSLLFNDFTPATWIVPESEPFMAWGQRAAIPKNASHPEAAKLYINWMLSDEMQQNTFTGWSVREDIQPNGGLKPIWEYDNAHLYDFPLFMEDRQEAEIWRQTFALFFGDVQGDPTPGNLGIYPGLEFK